MSPRRPAGTTDAGSFERDVILSDIPVLVEFWAPWCPPCQRLRPTLVQAAAGLAGAATVLTLNVDESPEIADIYGIRSIPAILLFLDGEPVEGWSGLPSAETLVERTRRAIDLANGPRPRPAPERRSVACRRRVRG